MKFIKINNQLIKLENGIDKKNLYSKFIKENNSLLDRDLNFNSMFLGYYTNDVDIIISGGISKGYRSPWYDVYSHV